MTPDNPPDNESPIVGCTLSAAEHERRLAWIDELNTAALHGYRREGATIELTYEPSAVARVREFVDRERECCPFLHFTIRSESRAVVLTIKAPGVAGEAADALFASYTDRL